MWTLLVINMVYATDVKQDVKFTRYADYESHETCSIALDKLEKEFKMGEEAICVLTQDKPKPIPVKVDGKVTALPKKLQ